MSHATTHLAALGLLLVAFVAPGVALERALLRDADLSGLRGVARVVLGLVAWMTAVFGLAVLGWLGTPGLTVTAALAVVAAIAATVRWGRAGDGDPRAAALFGLAALALTLPLTPVWLTPQISWDADVYHLALPKLYLAEGGFVPVAFSVYAKWPQGTELLFAAALGLGDHVLAKGVHYALGLLAAFAAFSGCRAAGRPAAGWIAAPLFLANPITLFELGIAYVDLAGALFLTAAVLFVQRWRERGGAGALALAGVSAGALAATKVTGIALAAVVGALCLPVLVRAVRQRDAAVLRRFALCFVVPVLALWLPWLAKSAWETGNPVYPLLHAVFGGPEWSAPVGDAFAAWQRSIGMGRAAFDYLLLPLRAILGGGGGYDHFHGDLSEIWIALLPLAAIFGWRVPLARTSLIAAALAFVVWGAGSQQLRFLIPSLPLWAIAAALAGSELWRRLPQPARRIAPAALGVAAAAFFLWTARAPIGVAATLWPRLADPSALETASVHPVYRFVDAELPESARLLLVNTNRVFWLERPHLADSFFEASQLADWLRPAQDTDALRALLDDRGVTHVLVEARDWGIAWPDALWSLLRDPAHASRRYRATDGRFELFELTSPR